MISTLKRLKIKGKGENLTATKSYINPAQDGESSEKSQGASNKTQSCLSCHLCTMVVVVVKV